jgi:hypothetical protein
VDTDESALAKGRYMKRGVLEDARKERWAMGDGWDRNDRSGIELTMLCVSKALDDIPP